MDDNTIKRILSMLPTPLDLSVKPKKVTEADLHRWAGWMATKKGYIHSRESLTALERYLQGYALLLSGGVGSGKTMFFECISGDGIEIVPLAMFAGWKLDETEEFIMNRRDCEMVIDDVGAEPPISEYGIRQELLPHVIEWRMHLRKRTHFTTNLTADDIQKRYGVRTIDRLYGMAYPVVFKGDSRRECQPRGE